MMEGGLCVNVVDAVSGRERQVAPPSKGTGSWSGGESRYPPIWSRKSDKLYIEAHYEDEPPWFKSWVYEVAADGNGKPVRVTERGVTCWSYSAADDILYVDDSRLGTGIYEVTFAGGKPKQTLLLGSDAPPYLGNPRISPSGKMLAYCAGRQLRVKLLKEGVDIDVPVMAPGGGPNLYYWVSVERPAVPPKNDVEKKGPNK